MKLLDDVLKRIKPKNKKMIMDELGGMLKKINNALQAEGIKAKAVAGGSIAKDTFLSADHDCDIFVKFNYGMYKDKSSKLSELLEKVLKRIMKSKAEKLERLHGSRDYFQIRNEMTFEIVPVLDIKDPLKAVNITDCSPLHVNWVKKFPKMNDEIRLAKAFAKANRVYGAESYKKSFSGHVMDILTINSGGFLQLLRDSKKWKKGIVIDYYNIHKGKAHRELNQSKLQSPLVVIDPIEPNRNAAAALSDEKFELFKKAAADFLKKPDLSFFTKKSIMLSEVHAGYSKKKQKINIVALDVTPKTGKEDVVGAKIMKAYEYMQYALLKNDFEILESDWEWEQGKHALIYFVFDKKSLPKEKEITGPPLDNEGHVKAFKKKHKNTFEKKGKIYAKEKRKFVDPERFIKSILDDKYLKERVKKIKINQ